uniref:3-dehydroquinate synthase domain-containing protein n=1 Tax=Pinguiococcus pyrenoidosus TaxID=172671 RepID=A0A7R9YCJ0_9STRA
MHGEAVNVDGWLCVLLSLGRGYINHATADRVYAAMKAIGMPTCWEHCTTDILWKGLEDAVEHRHGKQRLPLITGIGSSVCVNDITKEELRTAVEFMHAYELREGKA